MGTDIALALVMVFIMLNKLRVLVLSDEPDHYVGKTKGYGYGSGYGYGNGDGNGSGDGWGSDSGSGDGTGGVKQDEDSYTK